MSTKELQKKADAAYIAELWKDCYNPNFQSSFNARVTRAHLAYSKVNDD